MNEVHRIHRIMDELDLPAESYVLNGSAVLALHKIPRNRPMGDLDIFCATSVWFDVLTREGWELEVPKHDDPKRRCDPACLTRNMYDLRVDVYCQWRRRGAGPADFDPAFYILNAERVHELRCTPLQFIMDWKMATGRTKDLHDVIAIREHLGLA